MLDTSFSYLAVLGTKRTNILALQNKDSDSYLCIKIKSLLLLVLGILFFGFPGKCESEHIAYQGQGNFSQKNARLLSSTASGRFSGLGTRNKLISTSFKSCLALQLHFLIFNNTPNATSLPLRRAIGRSNSPRHIELQTIHLYIND